MWQLQSATCLVLLYSCSLWKLPSCGGLWMLVSMQVSFLSSHCTDVKSNLGLTPMSPPNPVSLSCILGPLACPACLVWQFHNSYFSVQSLKSSGEEKKLSTYNLWAHPSNFLVSSVTVAWVAVTCYVMHFLSFPNEMSCHVYPTES